MMVLTKITMFVLMSSSFEQVHANVFLGKFSGKASSEKASLAFEHALLGELESVLGSEHRTFTERRLSKIEDVVRPIVSAMPQNEHGKLEHGAVSYVLHRLFVQRHAWFINGLEPTGDFMWNATSPITLFVDRVPEYVQTMFEKLFGRGSGLGVHEIAVLAATFEHLVHKEATSRLQLAYKAHAFSAEDVTVTSEVTDILETYMSVYILGFMLNNSTEPTTAQVQQLRKNVHLIYPTWPDTQNFVHEVQASVTPERDYLYFSDVATVVEEIGERYGRWQDLECRSLRETLLAVEDTGPGGAGRVRLADFYGLALRENKWQYSESVSYLRDLGALDESDPMNPRVIITNYVYGPSNCVASSSYYSVCCIDDCESLLASVEQQLAKPRALPKEIVAIVSSLVSPTQQTSRELSPWLIQQLENVAAHHGGMVPLHGRLFSQWMHFAFPRECSYPHVSGSIDPMHLGEIMLSSDAVADHTANADEMKKHVESMPSRVENILNASSHEELSMFSMEEELVVWAPPEQANEGTMSLLLRGGAVVGAIVALSGSLIKKFDTHFCAQPQHEKYFV